MVLGAPVGVLFLQVAKAEKIDLWLSVFDANGKTH